MFAHVVGSGRVKRPFRRTLQVESLESRRVLAAQPIISEFVADNDGSLLDGDGVASDWVEIYNAGDAAVDLAGWHLTENANRPDKWQFPAVTLDAGRFLVVFASGHAAGDYVDPAGNLHTNFNLSREGEYLALTRPDLSVAWEYAAAFPVQRPDTSYGVSMSTAETELVDVGAAARTMVPTFDLGTSWTGGSEPYDDTSWSHGEGGTTGVGYSVAPIGVPGLVAEWSFETRASAPVSDRQLAVGVIDETAGDKLGPYDGIASGNPGQVVGGLSYSSDVPAGIGSSYSLVFPVPENASNYVDLPIAEDHALSNITMGDFRVEAWFKTVDPGRGILAGTYVGPATALNLELHTNNRGRVYVQGLNGLTDLNVTLPTNSRDGTWHHLAGVRRGATVELYYDGNLVGSVADSAGSYVINKPTMYIGRDSRATNVVFNGSLDNVRFYASADTSQPIAIYDFETSAGLPVAPGQSAMGQVDDTAGSPAGPYHGTGHAASGAGVPDGINYTGDVPAQLATSNFAIEFQESNPNVESFRVSMSPVIADLTQGDFTIQAWFKSTDVGRSILFGAYTGSDSVLNLELHTSNRLRVYIQNINGGITDLNVPVDAWGNSRDGQWHFATAVRRGDDVELYYDGELVGQTADIAGAFVQTASDMYFGRDSRTGETQFDGALDDVRFWDVALSAEQIVAMSQGSSPEEVTGGVYDRWIGTNVEAEMRGVNTGALVRIPFHVDDAAQFSSLKLRMQYDDGFVAYLNGTEVARSNVPDVVHWNSTALVDRRPEDGLGVEQYEIGNAQSLVREGTNILAVHGLTYDLDATEFLVLPELIGVSTTPQQSQLRYFTQPSPGGPNGAGVRGFVGETSFSEERGFYDAADTAPGGILAAGIAISTPTPGATIRYTVDGTWPTPDHGLVYTSPIAIETTTILRAAAFVDEYQPSTTVTHTYLFLDDVIRQPANPGHNAPGDPTYPLAFPLTHQAGVPADYEMDPDVVNHPLYRDTIKDDLLSIPTMSLVMDMDDVFSQPHGIWSNSQNGGRRWERVASVEYFDPNDPDREFHVNSAIRIQGRASRVPASSIKHSFRLIFKPQYGPDDDLRPTGGPAKLEYPLFDGSSVDRFDTLVLRGGYNYSYLHGSNDQNIRAQYLRETFMRHTQIATGQLGSHGTYVHLYVNGLYFGLYAPQERPDASFMAQHLGGEKEEYDVISAGEVRDGTSDAWNELLTRASQDLSVPANYDAVMEYLDVDSLIDYMIVHIWGGTTDWPAPGGQLRNWVVGRERKEGAGFKFFVWDAEYSIQGISDNVVNVNDANTPAYIYSQLRANPEFRLRFADRVQRHFFNDGALTSEATIARYAALADAIDRAIVGESARWGDARGDACSPCLRDPLWVNERDWILESYLPLRTDVVLQQFIDAGLYPATAAPRFSQHGGSLPPGTELQLNAPASDQYFDTPLADPSADAMILVPTTNALGTTWTQLSFEPGSDWLAGTAAIGYERGSGYETLFTTDVGDLMFDQRTSVYARIGFQYDGSTEFDRLQLRMRYDDGFVAYINGVEVARSNNLPAGVPNITTVPGSHEASSVETFNIDLSSLPPGLLADGNNVLAIHGMNRTTTSTDLLFLPELVGQRRDDSPTPRPIWYTVNGEDPRLPGGMINPEAIQYSGPFTLDRSGNVQARVFHGGQWSALTQAHFVVTPPALRITEVNYHPSEPTVAERLAMPGVEADDFEFLELQNTDAVESIALAGFAFVNGIEFNFGGVTLAPGEFAVLVEDSAAFQLRYGDGVRVLGEWSGALSNNGERLTLADPLGGEFLDFEYNDAAPWPQRADGAGASLELISPEATSVDEVGKVPRWRGSTEFGGSPGRNSTEPIGVLVTEVFTRSRDSGTSSVDAIELYNTLGHSVDISGWYLSDSVDNLFKFRIPDGTSLAAGAYRVFDERDFNAESLDPELRFALDGLNGDDVWLVQGSPAAGVSVFVDDVHFSATHTDVTLGRLAGAMGTFVSTGRESLGCDNTTARPAELVLSEVHYRPGLPSAAALQVYSGLQERDLEFLEISNPTTREVQLGEWRVRGGVDYDFPDGMTLAPGASVIVTGLRESDPDAVVRLAAFRTHYGISGNVVILQGWDGRLSDEGEQLRLERSSLPPNSGSPETGYIVEDLVTYDTASPWPVLGDDQSQALSRRRAPRFGSLADNWHALPPSPGTVVFDGEILGDFSGDGGVTSEDIDALFDAVRTRIDFVDFDLNGDSTVNQADVVYLLQTIMHREFGDADLDGMVDGSDLAAWNSHAFQTCQGWSSGDFNGDGLTDGKDFNLWNQNKFTVVGAAAVGARSRLPKGALAKVSSDFTLPSMDVVAGDGGQALRSKVRLATGGIEQGAATDAWFAAEGSVGRSQHTHYVMQHRFDGVAQLARVSQLGAISRYPRHPANVVKDATAHDGAENDTRVDELSKIDRLFRGWDTIRRRLQ